MAWKAATLQAVLHPEDALSVILRLTAEMPNLRQKLDPLIEILEKINQADSESWFEIGRFLFDNQEWDLAENAFLQSTRLRPGDSEGWAMLGESKLMQEEEGYPDLVKAIRLNERSRLGRYFLAKYWRERGQIGIAMKYLESMAAEEPGESLWKIELAKTAYLGGDTANALVFYQSAAKIDPGNIRVWQALGEFCLVNGIDLKGACEAAVQQSILLGPDDPVSNDLMGWLLLAGGDPDNALKFMLNSLSKDAGSARSHLHYAQALIGVGDMQSAKEELQQALSLDTGGPVGLTAGRLLQQYFGGE
jgi:tetratricopeptide (TPR) repeat protein